MHTPFRSRFPFGPEAAPSQRPSRRAHHAARTIVPYAVEGLVGEESLRRSVVTERVSGLDLFVDPEAVSDADAGRAVAALRRAADALEARFRGPGAGPPAAGGSPS